MEGKMEELTYEQTVELEKNIKIKNEANSIYANFLKNIKLEVKNYKGENSWQFWRDEHNATYFVIRNDTFYFVCKFLHETYDIEVTPSGIFAALKNERSGINHLVSAVRDRPNN